MVLGEEFENPFVELREERRYKRPIAAMSTVNMRIEDLGFCFIFGFLWIAIDVAEEV